MTRGCSVPFVFGSLLSFVVLSTARAQGGESYAFLVGVRQYDPAELTALQFTERDVTELAKLLEERGYDRRNIVLMTQKEGAENFRRAPTGANIRRELNLLLGESQAGDSILVAFSGHGVQFREETTSYFCPIDAQLKDRDTLISFSEVFASLEKCPAQNKLLLVDACRNDPQSTISKSAREVELAPAGRRAPPVPPGGVAAFFSCAATQQSFEDPNLQHGVFFHYLLRGLKGDADLDSDRTIDLPELEKFAIGNVQKHVRTEIGRHQTPERHGSTRGVMTLVMLPIDQRLERASIGNGLPSTDAPDSLTAALKIGDWIRVMAKKAPLRDGERTVAHVNQGSSFRVRNVHNHWVLIGDDATGQGWIHAAEVMVIPAPPISGATGTPTAPAIEAPHMLGD